ncbi:MAG: sulfatase-like hydrolase/transferase [Terasakiella sp.]|nr:sulfatase-like hydrolase/transferase [Terasakiella sp.]
MLTVYACRAWGVSTQDELQDIVVTYHADNPTKILHALATISVTEAEHDLWLGDMRRGYAGLRAVQRPLPCDTLDIVLVIGESYARSHSQLYGYRLPTTPFQMEEALAGRSIVFDSVYSTARRTSPSLRALMSLSDEAAGEGWVDSVFWPLVFKRAGWEVVMLDNQRVEDATVAGYTLNAFLYNGWLTDSVYTRVSDYSNPSDDMQFIDSVAITPPVAAAALRSVACLYTTCGGNISRRPTVCRSRLIAVSLTVATMPPGASLG